MPVSFPTVDMGAATEMSRLDSLPTEKLNELLEMEGVPAVTSSSNGKVLTVVSGKWKAANLPAELPDYPETAGTYTLQLVVTGDSAALSWESVGT